MPALVDLTGQRFGRWAVVRRGANNAHGQARWNCVCDCPDGSAGLVLGGSLRGGRNHVGACNGGGPVSICAEIAWAESMVMRRGVLRRQNIGLGRV